MGSFLLRTILFLSQPMIGGLSPGLQWFVPQPHGWNVLATPRLDEGAEGQGGHLLRPFSTFVGQSWVRGWTMSLLFLERRNLGGDNKALSALAWGWWLTQLCTLPQALTNVIKK